jgi:hypothetical protein
MTARYYTTFYSPDADGVPGNDQFVHVQSNRICIVGLAPSHPIVRGRLVASSVVYAPQMDKLNVSGKRKHGNVFVDNRQPLATVTTACGRVFVIRAGMRGDVLELNAALATSPGLVASHPTTNGHIAVLDVKLHRLADMQKGLLGWEDYAALCAARGLPSTFEAALVWKASGSEGGVKGVNGAAS